MATEVYGDSREAVALSLMEKIATSEGISFSTHPASGFKAADRQWILDTYAACLDAVKDHGARI